MEINIELLRELDLEPKDSATVIGLRFRKPYFSLEFVNNLRNELLNKLILVHVGVDRLTASDQLLLDLFDDLCEGRLLNKENKKEDND